MHTSFSTASTHTVGYMEEEYDPNMISVVVLIAMKPENHQVAKSLAFMTHNKNNVDEEYANGQVQ